MLEVPDAAALDPATLDDLVGFVDGPPEFLPALHALDTQVGTGRGSSRRCPTARLCPRRTSPSAG